jgi:hypothetical protein
MGGLPSQKLPVVLLFLLLFLLFGREEIVDSITLIAKNTGKPAKSRKPRKARLDKLLP